MQLKMFQKDVFLLISSFYTKHAQKNTNFLFWCFIMGNWFQSVLLYFICAIDNKIYWLRNVETLTVINFVIFNEFGVLWLWAFSISLSIGGDRSRKRSRAVQDTFGIQHIFCKLECLYKWCIEIDEKVGEYTIAKIMINICVVNKNGLVSLYHGDKWTNSKLDGCIVSSC